MNLLRGARRRLLGLGGRLLGVLLRGLQGLEMAAGVALRLPLLTLVLRTQPPIHAN
jgi:hypothetical protein